jgi:hypothetical protein
MKFLKSKGFYITALVVAGLAVGGTFLCAAAPPVLPAVVCSYGVYIMLGIAVPSGAAGIVGAMADKYDRAGAKLSDKEIKEKVELATQQKEHNLERQNKEAEAKLDRVTSENQKLKQKNDNMLEFLKEYEEESLVPVARSMDELRQVIGGNQDEAGPSHAGPSHEPINYADASSFSSDDDTEPKPEEVPAESQVGKKSTYSSFFDDFEDNNRKKPLTYRGRANFLGLEEDSGCELNFGSSSNSSDSYCSNISDVLKKRIGQSRSDSSDCSDDIGIVEGPSQSRCVIS